VSVSKYIREYIATYYDDDNHVSVRIYSAYSDRKSFSHIPTKNELEVLFDASGLAIDVSDCFEDCSSMVASPKLPNEVYDSSSLFGLGDTFLNCTALKIPPAIPAAEYSYYTFDGCTALEQAPVIHPGTKYLSYMFRGCSSLLYPVSIPATVKGIRSVYEGCSAMAGEMIVRATPTTITDALKDTIGDITLYGDKATCEAIAATSGGNASWSAWYAPVAAVTDREPGSYTTAADITRMVRNGALAVSSYAPGRMVYQQGDIVRDDEWNALVEAAQTIDPTVTYSTNYANLNKIEAAFDSAL
jgi:hypothetical protein